jgi:hypothetical protein
MNSKAANSDWRAASGDWRAASGGWRLAVGEQPTTDGRVGLFGSAKSPFEAICGGVRLAEGVQAAILLLEM